MRGGGPTEIGARRTLPPPLKPSLFMRLFGDLSCFVSNKIDSSLFLFSTLVLGVSKDMVESDGGQPLLDFILIYCVSHGTVVITVITIAPFIFKHRCCHG